MGSRNKLGTRMKKVGESRMLLGKFFFHQERSGLNITEKGKATLLRAAEHVTSETAAAHVVASSHPWLSDLNLNSLKANEGLPRWSSG